MRKKIWPRVWFRLREECEISGLGENPKIQIELIIRATGRAIGLATADPWNPWFQLHFLDSRRGPSTRALNRPQAGSEELGMFPSGHDSERLIGTICPTWESPEPERYSPELADSTRWGNCQRYRPKSSQRCGPACHAQARRRMEGWQSGLSRRS